MSARLYDRDAKVWVEVPDERVTELVGKGSHGFEAAVDVPVVGPDGRLGTLPATDVEDAFRKGGFRWQTREDSQAWEQRAQRDIMQQQFGDQAIPAAFAGFTRSYIPFADEMAIGGAKLFGKGAEAQQGLRELKEQNPVANLVGEVGGLIAPGSIVGGVASKVGKGVEGLIAGDVIGSTTATGLKYIGKHILAKGIEKGVVAGAEGAIMGLNTGVSEAALGDPRDLGEVLFDHTLSGALWGGGTGGAFGAFGGAAPLLKSGIRAAASATGEALSSAIGKTGGKAIEATLSLAGEKELAGIVKGLTGPESLPIREAYLNGGKELAEQVASEVRTARGALQQEARVTRQGLDAAIKREPKAVREAIEGHVEAAGGQIESAVDEAYAAVQGHQTQLDAAIAEGTEAAGDTFITVDDATTKLIRGLEKDGTPEARALAARLSKTHNAQRAAAGIKSGERGVTGVLNAGGEVQIARDLRGMVIDEVGGLRNPRAAEKYIEDVTGALHGHPRYGQMIQQADESHAAFDGLKRFVMGGEKGTSVKSSILKRIQVNPEFRAKFQEVADRFSDLMPDFKAIAESASESGKWERIKAFQSKLAGMEQGGLRRLSTDDIIALSEDFGKADWLKNATRLKEIETALSTEGVGSIDRYVRLKQALGEEVPDLAKQLAPHSKEIDALRRLEKATGQPATPGLVSTLIRKGVKAGIGYAVGGPVGAVLSQVVEVGGRGGLPSASAALNTLTRVQLAARKNTERIGKATNAVISALTSSTAAKVGVAAATRHSTLAQSRENYQTTSARLEFLGDIHNRIDTLSKALDGLEHAPNLQAALGTQFGQVVDFITSKMPRDPIAHKSFMGRGASSDWTPSDFELAKFKRYTDAAQDPVHTLSRLASGDVTPEEIETLETIYPRVFERLREGVMDAIMDPKVKPTYHQRLQIGTLLKVPADATLDPKFVATMQGQYAADQGGRPQGGGGGFSGGGASGSYRPSSLNINTQAMSSDVSRISEK